MHGSIIIYLGNYTATAGPTIPIFGGIPIAPLAGSFLGIVASVVIAIYTINRHRDATEDHIEAVKQAATNQINDTRHWRDVKRKQLLKSLIDEIELNIRIYKDVSDVVADKKGGTHRWWVDFHLGIIEECLVDTPIIDNDRINSNLLNFYHLLKINQNNMLLTRAPETSSQGREWANTAIADDYTKNIDLFDSIKNDLTTYEKRIDPDIALKPSEEEAKKKGWWQFWK